jgi:flagellar hook-associated protein 2
MSSPTSQVSGLVSGMDWETTIQQLMAIEKRRPALIEARKTENETKLNLWAQIQSKVALLQGAAQGIDTRSEFAVKSASSSDTTIVAVSAGASAATGAHSVEVLQLAKAHRIAGQGWADKNSTGVGDSGGDLVISINGKTITVADAGTIFVSPSLSRDSVSLCKLQHLTESRDKDGLTKIVPASVIVVVTW